MDSAEPCTRPLEATGCSRDKLLGLSQGLLSWQGRYLAGGGQARSWDCSLLAARWTCCVASPESRPSLSLPPIPHPK